MSVHLPPVPRCVSAGPDQLEAAMSPRILPFLMTQAEAMKLKRAETVTGLSVPQLRRINRRYRIARQAEPCAPLEISYPALVMIQHGDIETLEKLRAGQREDPTVRRYFDLCGLP